MQNQLYTNSYFRQPKPAAPSAQAVQAMAILVRAGMSARLTGRAAIPESDVLVEDWTFRRLDLDSCNLPAIAWKPVLALERSHVRPLSYVIAHEPKRQVTEALVVPAKAQLASGWQTTRTQLQEVGKVALPVAADVAKAALKVAAVSAVTIGWITLGALGVMASVILADPILFAVYEADDGGLPVFVEIARWHEE